MTDSLLCSSPAPNARDFVAAAEWQAALFAERPRRLQLRQLKPSWPCVDIAISVHRNAPFEYIAEEMPPFLAYAGYRALFSFSEYDDSLQFSDSSADLHLVWLDFERYRGRLDAGQLVEWLSERLQSLRSQSKAPMLVSNWAALDEEAEAFNAALDDAIEKLPGARVYDRRPLIEKLNGGFWDGRLWELGATVLSGAATLEIARDLGLRWIPAAMRPRIKCVAVDLDHTLYEGVLGEDGIDGLVLTPLHEALQRRLLALREEGVLLAVISKNEPADVEAMFAKRSDFPLQREHISATAIGWNSKADGLAEIARVLNIGTEAILFVDDNIGEIANVQSREPNVSVVHAADPALALAELTLGPDLLAWGDDDSADLRAHDLAANIKRGAELAIAVDSFAYLATLETRLDFYLDAPEHLKRVHDLSRKTNQFNLALKRLEEAEVSEHLAAPNQHIVTIGLSDRLSESGIIAMMLVAVGHQTAIVEELCVSCRALGRRLEDLMIIQGLEGALKGSDVRAIEFDFATGPRNTPALQWLETLAGKPLAERGRCRLSSSLAEMAERVARLPVATAWH